MSMVVSSFAMRPDGGSCPASPSLPAWFVIARGHRRQDSARCRRPACTSYCRRVATPHRIGRAGCFTAVSSGPLIATVSAKIGMLVRAGYIFAGAPSPLHSNAPGKAATAVCLGARAGHAVGLGPLHHLETLGPGQAIHAMRDGLALAPPSYRIQRCSTTGGRPWA